MTSRTCRGPGHTALYAFSREQERAADGQLAGLQEVAAAQGGALEWYSDWHGTPEVRRRAAGDGAPMVRPAYCSFLVDLRAGKVAWLVVWRLDKLGLGQGGLAELLGELAGHGAGFSSLEDGLCLEPEVLAELPAVLQAAVFMERRLMGARTAAGQDAAKKNGKRWGGSSPGRLQTVTEEQQALVRALYADGRPKAEIARTVGLDRGTVQRLLGARRGGPRRAPGQ